MDLKEAGKRAEQLVEEINVHDYNYYVSLLYQEGVLVRGATRGDGQKWIKDRLSNSGLVINRGQHLFCNKVGQLKDRGISRWM